MCALVSVERRRKLDEAAAMTGPTCKEKRKEEIGTEERRKGGVSSCGIHTSGLIFFFKYNNILDYLEKLKFLKDLMGTSAPMKNCIWKRL